MNYRPIQTWYAGHHFRSRLEARWAVFFDALGIDWEYEPEGFELPSGRYLPDFLLRSHRCGLIWETWFEVKPDTGERDPAAFSDLRWSELAHQTGSGVVTAVGMPKPFGSHVRGPSGPYFYLYTGEIDEEKWSWRVSAGGEFIKCRTCGLLGMDLPEMSEYACGHSKEEPHPDVREAYRAAKSARFEFGQSGAA